MIPVFKLKRSIEIQVTRFSGEVAQEEKRPELMPFLIMARDHGSITASSVAAHLLGAEEGRRQIARRLLEKLVQTGSIEALDNGRWGLTAAGDEALEKKALFIPERGSWEVWSANDPLLPHGLIDLIDLKDHQEPGASEEVRDAKLNRDSARPRATLANLRDRPLATVMGGDRWRIDELPERVKQEKSKTGTLTWEVGKNSLSLTVDDKSYILHAPEISQRAAFEALLKDGGLISDWDVEREVLRRGFDDVHVVSRRSMREDISFSSPVLPHPYGRFDKTTVCGIDIAARTRSDAEAWAAWRLEEMIDDVACTRRFGRWREQACTPFAAFMPLDLPSRNELAARTRPAEPSAQLSNVAWNLAAAEDWNL